MSSAGKIVTLFPGVPWTGSSNIHRSLAAADNLPFDKEDHDVIMHLLTKEKVGEAIWTGLQKYFSKAEFLVDMPGLSSLALVDISRHLRGLGDLASEHKLTNPVTGNKFHRIALAGDVVCGIRFWAEQLWPGAVNIGFRFRCEVLDEEEERVRVRMRETMERVETEMEVMQEAIFDVKEPSPEVTEKVKKMVEAFEEGN